MNQKVWTKVLALVLCTGFGVMLAPGCDQLGLGGDGGGGAGGGGGVGGGDAEALLEEDLDAEQPEGGVICNSPGDCLNKCNAEAKYCGAAKALHPYKADQIGGLYECIDRFPKAKYGGSFTCLYTYPNGDACIFAHGAKFGPIHPPAPPPLCVYKSP